MKVLTVILVLGVNMLSQTSRATEQTGSLLGKPLTILVGSLDQYIIEVSQSKSSHMISVADARYALEHTELIDPTLPEVRYNDFPWIATLHLIHRDHPSDVRTVKLCSLGLYQEQPMITYVFRYHLPEEATAKPTGKNIVMASSTFDAHAIAQKVKAGMGISEVIEALGQPRELKLEKDVTQWFYTYEFSDKSAPEKWMTLIIEFKNNKTIHEGFWLPNG